MESGVTVHEIRHKAEGYVRFQVIGTRTKIVVNWPFDRETDEWIRFTVDLPLDEVSTAVSATLAEGGENRVTAETGEEFALKARGERIDLDVRARGNQPPRFIHTVSEDDLFALRDALKASARGAQDGR